MMAPINDSANTQKPPLMKIYLADLCSNNPTIAIPQNGHRPARNPYIVPDDTSVLCAQSAGQVAGESAKNIARLAAINNESTNAQP